MDMMLDAPATINTLAKLEARKAVKAEMLAHGIKLRDISLAQLSRATRLWMLTHPECFQLAAESVRNSPRLRALAEREACQRAKLLTDARRNAPCETTTIPVQISGAK